MLFSSTCVISIYGMIMARKCTKMFIMETFPDRARRASSPTGLRPLVLVNYTGTIMSLIPFSEG